MLTDGKIEVEKDGVKLGWNIMAIIASIGLALYVSSVVSPLVDLGKRNELQIEKMNTKLNDLSHRIKSHIDLADYYIKNIETLNDDVKKLSEGEK